MAAGKRVESNTMLYTVITFVGLFIATTTLAVIYYVRYEEQRKLTSRAQSELSEVASSSQLGKIGGIIGSKTSGQTYLGKMVELHDEVVSLFLGGVAEDTSAQVKTDQVLDAGVSRFSKAGEQNLGFEISDPNAGLVSLIDLLITGLSNTISERDGLDAQLADLQQRFDSAMSTSREKEKSLLSEKDKYKQQVFEISRDYNDLEALMAQSTDEQIETLSGQLELVKTANKDIRQQLLKNEAELSLTRERLESVTGRLEAVVPPHDANSPAYHADAEVILIDNQANVVHLDIGRKSRVYQGLTFSVYNRNMPIPKDGKGKAEVEIYDVGENTSTARIIRSKIKNPIVLGDVAINLIWDRSETYSFVVAGEFDLNDDGNIDYRGKAKIIGLVERWNGRVEENVGVNTNFVILGQPPKLRDRPTFEERERNPMAMEEYEESRRKYADYQEVLEGADKLRIPIFNTDRFLYFIGYKSRAQKVGAF